MPIYEYRCTNCGHEREYLQKISDPPVVQCPECGQSTFVKKVTAAGFQLKGTGWYVTDFRDKSSGRKGGETKADDSGGAAKAAGAGDSAGGEAKSGESTAGESRSTDAKPAADTGSKAAGGGDAKGGSAAAKPAAAGPSGGS